MKVIRVRRSVSAAFDTAAVIAVLWLGVLFAPRFVALLVLPGEDASERADGDT